MKERKRISREKRTLVRMIDLYCKQFNYNSEEKFKVCRELLSYALDRIKNCPYGRNKPVCSKCKIHCYNSENRKRIKDVMRYSGPRMIFRHPFLTMMHFIDSLKKYPEIENKRQGR